MNPELPEATVIEMVYLSKPPSETIQRFLLEQSKRDFTYSAVGGTFAVPPAGYRVDHTRVQLGSGREIFEAAIRAIRRWDQFRLDWLEAGPDSTPIEAGQVVAVSAKVIGLWWLNACRIIRVVDEAGPHCRFGFAYGTLPSHVGSGEERFLIEWDQSDNTVWYDILAFSRPNYFLAKMGYPFVRLTQKRFGRESSAALRKIVGKAPINDLEPKK